MLSGCIAFVLFLFGARLGKGQVGRIFFEEFAKAVYHSRIFVLRQVVNRFYFLRELNDPFLRTFIQVSLGRLLPQFIITSCQSHSGGVHGYLEEVVQATQFLCVRFSMEYLSSMSKKKLYRDLAEICFLVPLYRYMFPVGPGQNVLKRVKAMDIPLGVTTFLFKMHSGVKTWILEKGLYVPWGVVWFLCKNPETVEHVFLNCWDGVFLRDVLQRTLKKEFPLSSYGIRFLAVQNDNGVPYDLVMLLVLHGIWRSRMAAQQCDVDGKPARQYFCESAQFVLKICGRANNVLLNRLMNLKRYCLCPVFSYVALA